MPGRADPAMTRRAGLSKSAADRLCSPAIRFGRPTVQRFAPALLMLSSLAFAQTPTADLAKPPADARHYIIQSTAGKHGDSWAWSTADGTRMARESLNLRGQVFEQDSSAKVGAD